MRLWYAECTSLVSTIFNDVAMDNKLKIVNNIQTREVTSTPNHYDLCPFVIVITQSENTSFWDEQNMNNSGKGTVS